MDKRIQKRISDESKLPGVNIRKLSPGTIIQARTRNSLYEFVVINPHAGEVKAKGGKHIPDERAMNFVGSTYGGSMIKPLWIGFGMNMELHYPGTKRILTTTGVRWAKVIGPSWEYELEWPSQADAA